MWNEFTLVSLLYSIHNWFFSSNIILFKWIWSFFDLFIEHRWLVLENKYITKYNNTTWPFQWTNSSLLEVKLRTFQVLPLIFSSVHFRCSVVSDSLRQHEPQHVRPAYPSPTPWVHPNPCPLSRWCHQAISSSFVPFSPALNLSQNQGLFKWVNSSHEMAKVLEFQLQHQSFQWTPRTDLL